METIVLYKEGVCIRIPREGIDERTLSNLRNLISNKTGLLKRALCADCVDVNSHPQYIDFPWFHKKVAKEDIDIAFLVISHLIQHAFECHRISAIEYNKKHEYSKDDCEEFLSRLGLIGDSYLESRERICSRFAINHSKNIV